MKQYEYKTSVSFFFSLSNKSLNEKMNAELNRLGAELGPEGWELVSCSIAYGNVVAYAFKREIQE